MAEKEKGFVVKDRRMFSQDGPPATDETPATEERPEQKSEPASNDQPRQTETPLPQINFPTFVASLNASALVHLGVIEDPVSGKVEKNLPMAKQTIDILGMIEDKTKGNLTSDEASMIKHILYELRMIYVKEKG